MHPGVQGGVHFALPGVHFSEVGCIFAGWGASRFLVEKLFSCDKLTTSIDYKMGVSDGKTVF